MLTTDLVRTTVRKGRIYPTFLKPNAAAIELATELVGVFDGVVGETRAELTDRLRTVEGTSTKFKIARGLAHVLMKRITFSEPDANAEELRRDAVSRAAAIGFPRPDGPPPEGLEISPANPGTSHAADAPDDQIQTSIEHGSRLRHVARALGLTPEVLQERLFADLPSAQRVMAFEPIEPSQLISAYNLALAQTLLLRATRMRVEITLDGELSGPGYRAVVRQLKFRQLLHVITQTETGYRIDIDGPASLFDHGQKYGFQMACFMPAIFYAKKWSVEADVLWGKTRRPLTFAIDQSAPLKSLRRQKGVYRPPEQALFIERLETLKSCDWEIDFEATLVPLGAQSVWTPDFILRHADGRSAMVEIIGYWRADYLQRRIETLRQFGPKNLILACSDKLRVDKKALEISAPEIIWFKRILRPKLVLERAEAVAV